MNLGGELAATSRSWQDSPWTMPLIALASSLAVMGILYRDVIEAAVRTWWYMPTYSHCFLIIPISIGLVWQDHKALGRLRPAPMPLALLLSLPLIAASLAGSLADINEIRQFAMIGYVQVIIIALFGPQIYRRISFPCLYLFFLVPTGEYLIPPLQDITTRFVATGLGLLSVPFHVVGNTFELPTGRYEIAEACAGLRFLIATVAVGVLFAHFTYRKWYKSLAFLLACAIVPVIANGFRALGIVLLAHATDNRLAAGADHLIYGWVFSVFIGLVLMFVGARFADPEDTGEADGPTESREVGRLRFILTAGAAMAVISAAPLGGYWLESGPRQLDMSALRAPLSAPGWSEGKVSGSWAPSFEPPDAKLEYSLKAATSSETPIDVFVYYYAGGRAGPRLIAPSNKMASDPLWVTVVGGRETALLGNLPLQFQELEIQSGSEMRLVWWTYWSKDRFTTSRVGVKLDKLQTTFTHDRGAALLAVSTKVDSDVDSAKARLRAALSALDGMPARLTAVSKQSPVKK